MTVDDPIITLGGDTAPSSDDNKDRGVEFRWHNGSAAKVGFFGFNDSDGQFTFIPDATNNSEVFSGAVGTINANLVGSVSGNASSASTAARWANARTVNFNHSNSDVTGSFSIRGDANVSNIDLQIGSAAVGATELAVTGNGTVGQVLRSDGDGTFTWITLPTGDTYTTSVVDSSGIKLRLTGTSGSTDDVLFTGTGGLTVTRTDASTINIDGPSAYVLPLASSSTRGGIKIGYTENGKNYPVELSSEKAFVNVPWVNTQYTAGTGLTLSGTVFNANVNGTNSVSPNASTNTSGRTYKVQVDSSDNLVVNVPWVDTNTQATVNNGLLDINPGNLIDLTIVGGDFTADKASETDITINVDLSELTDMTQAWNSSQDEFVVLDNGSQKRKLSSEIGLSVFNNDANFSTTTGTVTSVSVGTGLDVTNSTTTPSISLDLSEFTDMTAAVNRDQDEIILLDNGAERRKLTKEIGLSVFDNDPGFTANIGDITGVNITAGNGLSGTSVNTSTGQHTQTLTVGEGDLIDITTGAVNVDLSEATDMTETILTSDEFIVLDTSENGGSQGKRKRAAEIPLTIFSKGNFLESGDLSLTSRNENETFTGAEVPNNINITTNSFGQVTALNVTKRTLTLANLGFNGSVDAEENQNAFSNIQSANGGVNGTLHAADAKTDTFTINAGTNLSIVDGLADYITINNDITQVFNKFRISQSDGTTIATDTAVGISDTIHLRAKANITLTDEGSGVFGIASTNQNAYATFKTFNSGTTSVTHTAANTGDDFGLNFRNGISTSLYGASGSGLSIVDVDSDQRGNITQFGPDTNDYIVVDSNSVDFYLDGVRDMSLENDGELHVRGDVIAFSTTITSDEKLKENVQVVNGALELVSQLDGVTFNWKENGKASAGVIAQDVEKVLPSAVKEVQNMDKTDTHKVVDYNQLSALFIEAIKELKDENKLLKAEIESLKDINKGIE